MPAPSDSPTPRIDGRRLRSERTRQTIIEAYLALLRRSPAMPTAAQIAEEAGYSVRSVFERFDDLNALTLATADHAIVQGQAEAQARDVDADRPARIRSHVRIRAAACEKWLPLWRVLTVVQEQLPELKQRVALARHSNVVRMRLMYAPELATLEPPVADQMLVALAALISFESWDQMRSVFGLSHEAAEAAWRAAIDRILPPTPAP
ncbi:MAG: hypothetical protein JSR24_21975 [Proteobacteria bacterium]|nr:hypothetical protein [Pseudomonadota bacterium]